MGILEGLWSVEQNEAGDTLIRVQGSVSQELVHQILVLVENYELRRRYWQAQADARKANERE